MWSLIIGTMPLPVHGQRRYRPGPITKIDRCSCHQTHESGGFGNSGRSRAQGAKSVADVAGQALARQRRPGPSILSQRMLAHGCVSSTNLAVSQALDTSRIDGGPPFCAEPHVVGNFGECQWGVFSDRDQRRATRPAPRRCAALGRVAGSGRAHLIGGDVRDSTLGCDGIAPKKMPLASLNTRRRRRQ